MAFISPVRPSPKRVAALQPVLPGPDEISAFRRQPQPGLGRNDGEPLFSSEAGGIEPVEPPPPPSVGDVLKDRFGYSTNADVDAQNTASPQNVAARAGILSRPTVGLLDELPRAPGHTPTRDESAREDAYVNLQVQQGQAKQARIDAANAAEQAGIMQNADLAQRQQRMAAEAAFSARTGLPYDPKLAEKIAEFDQQAAEDEGFKIEMAQMDDRERQLRAAVKPDSPEDKAIQAHFDTARKERLLRMAIRAGVGVNGAFNVQRPPIDLGGGTPTG